MRGRTGTVVVWGAAIVYSAAIGTLALQRHRTFHTGYDLAIFEQFLWLLGHGNDPFSTIRGREFLGDHFQPGLALLTPLDLAFGVWGLLAAQTAALAVTAPLLQRLARREGASERVAAGVALLWLCSPLTHSANLFDFHPETFVPALVAGGALALAADRTGPFFLTAVLASSLKEDVCLLYLAWGFVVLLEGRRRLGACLLVGSTAWFVLATRVGIHAFGGNLDYYSHRFGGGRGATVTSILADTFRHPLAAAGDLATPLNVKMLAALVAITAGLCLLAPRFLLLALPALAANLLSRYPQQHYLTLHYHVVAAGVFAVAGAVGAGRAELLAVRFLRRRNVVPLLVAGASVVGLATSPALDVARGRYAQPPRLDGKQEEARRAAVRLVPAGVPVAASYDVASHLAERRLVYVLPYPYVFLKRDGASWTRHSLLERASKVAWVVLDDGPTYPGGRDEVASARRETRRLGFRTAFSRDGVVVLRRR